MSTIASLLAITALLQLSGEIAGRQMASPPNQPLIQEAQATPNHTLKITGQNFGTSAPAVNIDGVHLWVSSSSNTQIVAQLPPRLPPGSYLITVSTGAGAAEFDSVYMKVLPGGAIELQACGAAVGPAELRLQGLKEYKVGNLVGAQRLLDMALGAAKQKNDEYFVALIEDALGDVYQSRFDFSKAEQAYSNAVAILRRQPEHVPALAIVLRNVGAALSGERRFREASAFYEEAGKIVKDNAINDPQLEQQILNGIGVVYFHQGDSRKAKRLFVRALQMKSARNALDASDIRSNLATVYVLDGNYPKAAALYAKGLKLMEARFGPSHPDLTPLLDNLGFMYNRMHRYEDAEHQFQRSLRILKDNGMVQAELALRTLDGLSQTYLGTNQNERAALLLAEAIEIGRRTAARTTEMADTLELYSTLLRSASKAPEAEQMHTEAVRIRSELAWTTRVGGAN